MSDNKQQSQGQSLIEDKLKPPRRARVILLNDDYTSMDFVVQVLMEVFRKNSAEAAGIMMTVHEKGRGECGVYTLEIAETKVGQVHSRARAAGFPLRCVLEIL